MVKENSQDAAEDFSVSKVDVTLKPPMLFTAHDHLSNRAIEEHFNFIPPVASSIFLSNIFNGSLTRFSGGNIIKGVTHIKRLTSSKVILR